VLSLNTDGAAPLLNIFGGKLTTYRKLAEGALKKLAGAADIPGKPWTAGVSLAGGDFPVNAVPKLIEDLQSRYDFLTFAWARRLIRTYGTEAGEVLGSARPSNHLGRDFGETLSEAEVRWLMTHEFARTADDIVWRRTKLGLRMSAEQIKALQDWMSTEVIRDDKAS